MEEPLYTVVGPKSWSMMTSHELAAKLAQTDVALVPVGAIEQHGGALPLGQDNYQIEEIVRRAILKLDAAGRVAIFGPTIPFAPISNLQFPGSIDIKPSTLILLVKEICLNLHRDGVKKIVLVMGHDMSLGALMVAARELAAETADALQVIVLNWLPFIVKMLPDTFAGMPKGLRDGHGGAGETARMLAQHPKLVITEKLADYSVEAVVSPTPFAGPIVSGGGVYAPRKTSNGDPKFGGILGFPTLATPEVGEKLYDALAGWVAGVVGEYCYGAGSKAYNY
ncbi:MAG: creatininase family protein [Verrucomicrobiota bacterium]